MKKEAKIIIVLTGLLSYFLIGDPDENYWVYFYFLNHYLLILILSNYSFDKRFKYFLNAFFIVNLLRLHTKFLLHIDLDFIYKFIFATIFLIFILKNFKIEK